METSGLIEKHFWESQSCLVLSPPGREVESEEIHDALGKREGVVFATSGSSGPPKWVLFRRRALLASARAVNEHLAVSANDRFLIALPRYHVGGFGLLARAYDASCSITVMKGRWDPSGFREAIEKDGSTVTSLVPTQIHDLVSLSGSLIVGFAAIHDLHPAKTLWHLSRVDETWQQEQWGNDEEAEAVALRKETDFLNAKYFYDLSRG